MAARAQALEGLPGKVTVDGSPFAAPCKAHARSLRIKRKEADKERIGQNFVVSVLHTLDLLVFRVQCNRNLVLRHLANPDNFSVFIVPTEASFYEACKAPGKVSVSPA